MVTAALVGLEPELVTLIWYIPMLPRTKLPVCDLRIVKSGDTEPMVALALLLLEFGSVVPFEMILALF